MPELRRQHRIAYNTNVRLRASGRDHSVVAHVQNLSARGIFVTAADMPEAGSDVQCRIDIAGQARTLRGRVAWVRHSELSNVDAVEENHSGAGIEFVDLGATDTDLLKGLVDPIDEQRHPVDVSFEGMKAPIRCHAIISPESLQITTKLPFLRLASRVKVSFTLSGTTEVRAGTLGSITLDETGDDGIPQLCLNVATPPEQSAKGIIDVAPAPRVSTPAEGVLLSEPSTVVEPDVTTTSANTPIKLTPGMTLRRVPVADRDRTVRIDRPAGGDFGKLTGRRSSGQGGSVTGSGQPGWRASATGFVIGAVLVLGAGLVLRRRAVDTPSPLPSRSVTSVVAAPAPPVAVVAKPDPVVAVAPAFAASVAPAPAAVKLPQGLALDDQGDAASLSVSFSGSVRGARRYILANPPGLAIHLPRARARIETGVYKVNDQFTQLWIRTRGTGSNLRFFFDTRAYVGEIKTDRDTATLTLRPR